MPYVLGGIQRHSRMLLEHLARQGVRVTLYHTVRDASLEARARSLDDIPASVRESVHGEFVAYPTGPWFPGHYALDSARYSRALLAAFLRRQRNDPADFVYAQGLTGLAFVEARRRGVPVPAVGVNAHGYEMYQPCFGAKDRIVQPLMRPQHRRITLDADVVFSFSGKIREIVVRRIGANPSRVEVIPNAVDGSWIAESTGPSNQARRFLFVGRFERRKGVPELGAALRRLDGVAWHMDFVGPIPDDARIADDRITYHGAVTDIRRLIALYDGCDCIVCPSYAEGMPTVLIEAMARGVAVIATDVGAVAELVDAGTGILLPGPRAELIEAAMRRIATMPDESLKAMREACREKAREYTWERITGRVIESIQRRIATAG